MSEPGRREFLMAAGAATAAVMGSEAMAAAGGEHHHHHGLPNEDLVKSSAHCTASGNICISHCLILMGDGDTEMAACAKSVQQMLSFCDATGYHAASESKYLKEIVTTCKKLCHDCADECRKHEDKHVECKACGESCKKMVAACDTYLKTA